MKYFLQTENFIDILSMPYFVHKLLNTLFCTPLLLLASFKGTPLLLQSMTIVFLKTTILEHIERCCRHILLHVFTLTTYSFLSSYIKDIHL